MGRQEVERGTHIVTVIECNFQGRHWGNNSRTDPKNAGRSHCAGEAMGNEVNDCLEHLLEFLVSLSHPCFF
jgi:hypothetical protein